MPCTKSDKIDKVIVKTAEHCGFCSGVRRAVNMLYAELDKGVKIYLLGKIIHHDVFIDEMKQRGVTVIDAEAISKLVSADVPTSIVIRAHGIPKALMDSLEKLDNVNIVDATCVSVKRMHGIADKNTNDTTYTVIFGDSRHPEIIGLDSYVIGERGIFKDFEHFKAEFENKIRHAEKKLIILAQTTHNIDDWKKVKDYLELVNRDSGGTTAVSFEIFDTICNATDRRQKEAEQLSKESDIMLIVGGMGSANTQRLFEICKKHCAKSFIIETLGQLPLDIIKKISQKPGQCAVKVGITAGASTPDGIIKEVKNIMAEINKTAVDQIDGEQSFEEMLNESFVILNRGERIKGIVSHISGSEIYVDLGGQYTGVLAFDEVTNDPTADVSGMFKVGEEIEVQIYKTNDTEGTALLSRKRIDAQDNWEKIVRYLEDSTTVEGKVIQAVNGGLITLVDSVKVFVPASHAGVSRDTDLQTLVGNNVKVKIIDITHQNQRAIASIRNAMSEERKVAEQKIWSEIEEGKRYEGVVKSIASYGVFVDIGGVDGMVHITELSWLRPKHPSEIVKLGDQISVYVKSFEADKRRISLGYRDENDNPWVKFEQQYQLNDIVDVKISNIMPFGAFAEIIPGVDGLIHISEMTTDRRQNNPDKIVNIGDIVRVKIMKIDAENKKLTLSMIAAQEDDEKAIAEEAGVVAVDEDDVQPLAEELETEEIAVDNEEN